MDAAKLTVHQPDTEAETMTTIHEQDHLGNPQRHQTQDRSGLGAETAQQHGLSPHETGEGPVARAIEQQTARLPSDVWLWAAGGSILLSAYFQGSNQKHKALFVGNWAPTFLLLGIYNKLVKLHGSD
jgi:hypothetical protein